MTKQSHDRSRKTTVENTNLKYYAFLLNLYRETHSKAMFIKNQKEFLIEAKVNTLTLSTLHEMKVILLTQAKTKEGLQNSKTGKLIRWIGPRPTEELAREIVNKMTQTFFISVQNKKEREKKEKEQKQRQQAPPPVEVVEEKEEVKKETKAEQNGTAQQLPITYPLGGKLPLMTESEKLHAQNIVKALEYMKDRMANIEKHVGMLLDMRDHIATMLPMVQDLYSKLK